MSIFNLNNWFNFLTKRRVKKAKDTDILALGRQNDKSFNGWSPLGITVKDLKDEFGSTDNNNQTLEIAGEGDELALKNGSVGGVPIPDSVIPMEQIAQGFRLQDVGDVSAYSGNNDKILKVNSSGNGVEWAALAIPPSSDTAIMTRVAFVDPVNGNDLTGVVGDMNKPFRFISNAQMQPGVEVVYCEAGIHIGTVNMVSGLIYYFAPGAEKSSTMRDLGVSGIYRVYGHLRTTSFSNGFEFTGATTQAFIECDELRGRRNLLAHNGAKVTVNCNRFFSDCNNGGRYAVYLRNGGKVVLNVKEDCRTYHWLVGGGYGSGIFTTPNEFTINCPDIRILDLNTGGNAYKALCNHQGQWACTYTINGFVTHEETTTLTSAFGVTESALALCVNSSNANRKGEFHFKGGCRTVAQPILIEYYINYDALFTFSDGDYYSGRSVITVGVAGVGGAATNNVQRWKNCRLDSYHRIGSIGHGRTMHFENCSFNVRSTDQPRLFDGDGSNPGAGTPNLYMYNCIGEYVVPGTVPFLNNPTGSVNFNTVNTYSSETIGVGVTDNWGGYQQIIGFVVPKL
ncbi:MAG: hypothetical protein GTN59_07550 [Candidatus Dadabacteria bacterium]|nr:hypothetical protein [Candidatus Dadabacteria bacterium]